MVHQSLDSVETVHSHGIQEIHLFVKGYHHPIVLQIWTNLISTLDVS